jgi:hypothetical protein
MRVLVLLLAMSVCGCSSYKKDLQALCDVRSASGAAAEPDPDKQAEKMARWLEGNLRSADGIRLFRSLGPIAPKDKVRILRTEAAHNGVSPCAVADWMESQAPRAAPKP